MAILSNDALKYKNNLLGDNMTDFKIGSHNWSGISKLVEEAGEVMQVCGKLIGTGGKLEHWDGGPSLKDRLEEELADLQAAIEFVSKINHLDQDKINERVFAKYQLFRMA